LADSLHHLKLLEALSRADRDAGERGFRQVDGKLGLDAHEVDEAA
jgi:hypothetical protein